MPLDAAINTWMLRTMRREIKRIRESGAIEPVARIRKDLDDVDLLRLANILETFGLRRARAAGKRQAGPVWIEPPTLETDFIRDKEIKLAEFVANTNDQIRETVKRILNEAQGEEPRPSVGELASRMERELRGTGAFSPARAERVARTETVGAENFGVTEGYKVSGVEKEEWLTLLDDRTRDDHREMNGRIKNVGEPWILPDGTRLRFPGDPLGPAAQIIACRCTTAPVFDV